MVGLVAVPQALQNLLRRLRAYPFQNPLRQCFLSVHIEQKAVLLVHAPHIFGELFFCQMSRQQGKRGVNPPAKYGMEHNLTASRRIPEMLRQNHPIIRQHPRRCNLTL